ncbi:MAG: hypothetical protein Tsb002_05990 [Wenzhouxiangellaceae bacterium]
MLNTIQRGGALLLLLLLSTITAAQPAALTPETLDRQQLASGSLLYQMSYDGLPVGESRYTIRRDGGEVVLVETTSVPAYGVDANNTVVLDENLHPRRFTGSGSMGGQPVNISVEWGADRIRGHSLFPRAADQAQGQLTINREQSGALERTSVFFLLPGFPLQPGSSHDFHWYNTYVDEVRAITASVAGVANITTPAGEFETYRVQIKGGDPEQVVYVTTQQPRRIVRMEVVNQPWVYQLLPERRSDATIAYLVRHAEKEAEGDDPGLTMAGQQRAQDLARLLADAGITQIWSTTTRRTQATAEPLARQTQLSIGAYSARDMLALLPRLNSGSRSLIVGHSNTLPALVRMLGGDPGEPIDHQEYDRIYQLTLHGDGQLSVVLLRYGQPSILAPTAQPAATAK